MYDVVIVGAGIAGMTAAIYLARAGKNIAVFESKIHGGQIVSAINVGNWPGEISISGADLMEKVYKQMVALGVTVKYEEVLSVKEYDKSKNSSAEWNFRVSAGGMNYVCKSIIIATGTAPRQLSEKQTAEAGNRPVSYCATCDGALYKGKPVVVVGSGNTAEHEIKYLEGVASKVYHIHHDDPIPADAVAIFAAIGRVPKTGLVKDLVKLDTEGYILAGDNCCTSVQGVFVAGDCRTKSLRQLVTAASDGAMAAIEACRYLG